MKKLILRLSLFIIYILLIGEIVVRLFHITSDIPNREIKGNIQKYFPNQQGYWKGGGHQWKVNKKGWVGDLPESYDNLITIVGDSFIENLMNPNYCHQAIYLKKYFENYNFFEAGRSGVSLIEAMEIAESLENEYTPKYQLIYLADHDFEESIAGIARKKDITQINLETGEILPSEMKAPVLKKILYNWKFLFYLYSRFPLKMPKFNKIDKKEVHKTGSENHEKIILFDKLFQIISEKYNLGNKIFIFRPNTNKNLINRLQKYDVKMILLDNHQEEWTFSDDHHWTCYGHEQVSKQVAKFLKSDGLK